jgi:hypothetical protein
MASLDAAKAQLAVFRRIVRAVVRAFVYLALAAGVGVGLLGLALARDGLDAPELVVVVALLAAPAIVLVFAAGIRTLGGLPERVVRLPQRGVGQVDQLARLTADARSATWRRSPLLLWRTGSLVSSTRDLVRIALPLKIFTPGFLWLTLIGVVACLILVAVGLISLLVLAAS